MGGYVCFPGGMMASLLNRPLLLVNADAALLLSNKSLLPVADRVAFGFAGPAAAGTRHAVVTGNPVRAEIEAVPEPALRWAGREGPLRILVVGGSLGAQVLNQTVPAALALLPRDERPIVVHQTGTLQFDDVRAAYAEAGFVVDGAAAGARAGAAEVLPFIDDMPRRLAECDLMICRAGAITVSELCAAGVPAILVPLIVSTTAHQRENAQWMAGQGAAVHLPQSELTAQALADLLRRLTREGLLAMAVKARGLARPRAAARVADEIEALVKRP
jgi:UDP-N-acetylglucosamine--N-acetylmuramyl-(pentapeptide) pyrophosphoryl-undecaprenol N-acetylglucosamine transferase